MESLICIHEKNKYLLEYIFLTIFKWVHKSNAAVDISRWAYKNQTLS